MTPSTRDVSMTTDIGQIRISDAIRRARQECIRPVLIPIETRSTATDFMEATATDFMEVDDEERENGDNSGGNDDYDAGGYYSDYGGEYNYSGTDDYEGDHDSDGDHGYSDDADIASQSVTLGDLYNLIRRLEARIKSNSVPGKLSQLEQETRDLHVSGKKTNPKKSTEEKRFQKLVRNRADKYIGVRKGAAIPCPPDTEETEAILQQIENTGVFPESMVPRFGDKPTSDYNDQVSVNFYRVLLEYVESNEFIKIRIPEDFLTMEYVVKKFNTHVYNSLRSRWRYQNIKLNEDDKKALRKKSCRDARRYQLFNIRFEAAQSIEETKKLSWILRKIGPSAMSSDEEIEDRGQLRGHALNFRIIDKPWRSADLKTFCHGLDIIHANIRSKAGNPIRNRMPDKTLQSTSTRPAPKGLPVDCYDSRYLKGLSTLRKSILSPAKMTVFEKFDMSKYTNF